MRILAAGLALAGCAAPPARIAHPKPFPARVALLPLANHSNSLAGPQLIRQLIHMRLTGGLYRPMSVDEVDRRLRELGVTDGGQLGAIPPARLGEALQADGLLIGEVLAFDRQTLGVMNKRAVEVRLRLVDPATGATLWEATRRQANSKVGLSQDAIAENLAGGIAEKLVENVMHNPLRPESEDVVQSLMKELNTARKYW